MCKVVYLTSRSFDVPSREFKNALAEELKKRKVEVVMDSTCVVKRLFLIRWMKSLHVFVGEILDSLIVSQRNGANSFTR